MADSSRQTIDAIKDGARVEGAFALKMKKGVMPYQKGHSFHLILTDGSGRSVDYKYWGGADARKVKAVYDSISPDGVVWVQGRATTYMDKLQISANEPDIIRPLMEGEYDPQDFIPPARRDIEEMCLQLKGHVDRVADPPLKALLMRIFDDETLMAKLKRHPGAIEIHHNWAGGLLEHTLEVAEYAILSKRLFPALDLDLLIAGSLLHDIGKLEEIEVKARIKGSREGQLTGHIALGYGLLSRVMDELKTPKAVRERLLHIILSHHGSMEYGSPKPPMLPEAFAIYYADELSSKLSEITDFRKWAAENTEDDFMYHKRYQRNILLR